MNQVKKQGSALQPIVGVRHELICRGLVGFLVGKIRRMEWAEIEMKSEPGDQPEGPMVDLPGSQFSSPYKQSK
jgi:hypothetical protein